MKNDVKQLNGSQEIEEHSKVIVKEIGKITQSSFPGEGNRSENNFMDLGHQDNLCKVSKRSIALLEDIVDTQTE